MGHIGCLFEGTEASLVTNYTTHEVWVKGKKADDFPRPASDDSRFARALPRVPRRDQSAQSRDDLQRSLWASASRKRGCSPNIAFRTGRRIHWNDEQERIVDDREASRYLRRSFRKDYKL